MTRGGAMKRKRSWFEWFLFIVALAIILRGACDTYMFLNKEAEEPYQETEINITLHT